MTFFESIKTVFRKYAEFTGRATRPEFWWFALFSALVSGALASLNLTTMTGTGGYMVGMSTFGEDAVASTFYLGSSLAGLWGFVVLLPSLAVAVRRLRDAGHQWTEIFWILLPIAGAIILIVRLADPTKVDVPQAAITPPTPTA